MKPPNPAAKKPLETQPRGRGASPSGMMSSTVADKYRGAKCERGNNRERGQGVDNPRHQLDANKRDGDAGSAMQRSADHPTRRFDEPGERRAEQITKRR